MELSFAPVKHFTKRWVFQASPRRIVLVKNSEMNNISAKGFRDLEQMHSGGNQIYLNKGLFFIQPAVRRVRKDLKFGCIFKKVWFSTSTWGKSHLENTGPNDLLATASTSTYIPPYLCTWKKWFQNCQFPNHQFPCGGCPSSLPSLWRPPIGPHWPTPGHHRQWQWHLLSLCGFVTMIVLAKNTTHL